MFYYKFKITEIGVIDNLGVQFEKVARHWVEGSIETKYRYAEAFERFIKFVGIEFHLQKLTNIKDKHLYEYTRFLKNNNCSDKYIKTELSAIRFIHDMFNSKYSLENSLKFNKAAGLSRTPDGRVARAWTEGEITEMEKEAINSGKNYIANAIEFMRALGTRLDETCTIKTHQVDKALRSSLLSITNTKGGRPRTIDISNNERAIAILTRSRKDVQRGKYIFVSENKKVHKVEAEIEQFIIKHRDEIQISERKSSAHNVNTTEMAPLTAHGLRHTYAQHRYRELLEEGIGEETAKKILSQELGHDRTSVVDIYLSGNDKLEEHTFDTK